MPPTATSSVRSRKKVDSTYSKSGSDTGGDGNASENADSTLGAGTSGIGASTNGGGGGGGGSNSSVAGSASGDPEKKAGEKSKSKSAEDNIQVKWSYQNEQILVEWCDVAQCYKWLNSRAHNKYSYRNAWFTIPAITLSTISGTASFAQASIPIEYQVYAPMIIGSINILIGILTTIQQYLKVSELNEAHRVSAISWDKFARNIRIELAKSPNERMDAKSFIKISRQEFDRLMETSPAIPQDIVRKFKETFEGQDPMAAINDQMICCAKTFCFCCSQLCVPSGPLDASGQKISLTDYEVREREKRERAQLFKNLKKPDICDIIISAEENRYKVVESAVAHDTESAGATDSSANSLGVDFDNIDNIDHVDGSESGGPGYVSETELLLKQTLQLLSEHHRKEKEEEDRRYREKREEARLEYKNQKKVALHYQYIKNFIDLFVANRERNPTIEEIKEYFSINTKYGVTFDEIDDFLINQIV